MTAATNVLILWNTNGSSPSGWTDTGVDHTGRFIYIGTTVGSHGGASTHTHTYNTNSAGNSSATHHNGGGKYAYYDATTQAHTHSLTSTTVSSESSMPPYKDYGLYYRAISGWDGKVPSGTVAMIGTCPTNWTKVDDGSSYFIRVVADADTKGGTGGASTHSHTLSGTLSALTSSNQITGTGSNNTWAKDHGHTYSGSSSSQSNSTGLYYLGAGLVKADFETHVTQNMYLWFDGDVPATFDQVSDQGYVKQAASNTYATGGSSSVISHTHDNFSITSGAMSNSIISDNYSLGAQWVIEAHTHTVSGSLNSANVQPLYVGLVMGKAKATFYSTINSTYTMDTHLFGTANHTYTVDRRLKGTAQATYSVDRRLKGTANISELSTVRMYKTFFPTYTMDTSIIAFYLESSTDNTVRVQRAYERTYDLDLLSQKALDATYDIDTLNRGTFTVAATPDVCIQKMMEATYTTDVVSKIIPDIDSHFTAYLKTGSSEVMGADAIIVQCKHTGYSGRCDVLLQDIESGYGMAVEICSHPRHHELKRPVPYIPVPDTVPENVTGDNITLADIPGADQQPFVYPETTVPAKDNPITPTQYEETRGNEPNKKQPFTDQVVDSTKIIDTL